MRLRLPNAVAYGVTQADFPEQDWSVWKIRTNTLSKLKSGETVDSNYLNVWPCCIHCGTWLCTSCWSYRRSRASRRVSQYCAKCGGREGFFYSTRHGTRNPHMPEHVPRPPFMVPVMSTTGAVWDTGTLIRYYKDLTVQQPGRERLMENQVQPDELEHRDPGYSCEAKAPSKGLPAPPRLYEEAEAMTDENGKAQLTYPHPDGDGMVLGPEVFVAGNVISWKGENYYKRQVTDEDRKLIAANSKATIDRRDAERRKKLLQEMALHHAVELMKSDPSTSSAKASAVIQTADSILRWLTQED